MRDRAPARKLAAIQRWFQDEIVRPHEGGESRAAAAASSKARALVRPSSTLAPDERVAIYSRMYFARLVDCLEAEYRAVRHLLGENLFSRLCRAYLARHPSRHWSLNVLGRMLPEFLARGGARGAAIPRRSLVRDVARLENAMSEVFDAAPDDTVLAADAFVAHAGRSLLAGSRLVPIEAFRVLAFDWPASEIVTAVRQESPLPRLARKRSFIAVYRKERVVWRLDLDAARHACLDALARGKTVGAAIRAAAAAHRGPAEELEGNVYTWFRDWVAEGFFREIRRPRSRSRRPRSRR